MTDHRIFLEPLTDEQRRNDHVSGRGRRAALMSADEAREFRQAHDKDARQLSRKSKRELERIAAGFRERICGQSSRDELISEILGYRYPAGKLNEAIHVLHHAPGDVWSACAICTGGAA